MDDASGAREQGRRVGLRLPGAPYMDSRTGLEGYPTDKQRVENLRELEQIGLVEARHVVRFENLIDGVKGAETVEDLKVIFLNLLTERKDGRR